MSSFWEIRTLHQLCHHLLVEEELILKRWRYKSQAWTRWEISPDLVKFLHWNLLGISTQSDSTGECGSGSNGSGGLSHPYTTASSGRLFSYKEAVQTRWMGLKDETGIQTHGFWNWETKSNEVVNTETSKGLEVVRTCLPSLFKIKWTTQFQYIPRKRT